MPQFYFSKSKKKYLLAGVVVSDRKLSKWAQQTTEASEEHARALAVQLNKGEIDEREFQQETEDEIAHGHAAMAAAALGGLAAVSASVWHRVSDYIKEQLGYFFRFTQQRATGQTSEAENEQRTVMYAAGIYSTFANGTVLRETQKRDEIDEEDRRAEEAALAAQASGSSLDEALGAISAAAAGALVAVAAQATRKACRILEDGADHCDDCLDWAGEWPINDIPPIGSSVCGANCRCTIEFDCADVAAEADAGD